MESVLLNNSDFWLAEKCQSKCLVMVNERDATAVAEAEIIRPWVEARSELDGHVLFSTSGSMGRRKWVVLSRDALMASARAVNEHLGVTKKDKWLLALPLFHVGGMGILARSYAAGCDVVKYSEKWDAQGYHDFLEHEQISLSSLVPTQLVDLVNSGCEAPASLRSVLIGGGRLDDDIYWRATELGWPVVETYGMTETASQVATAVPGSGSRSLEVLPIWKTRTDEQLRLWLSGTALMVGYVSVNQGVVQMVDPKRDGWFLSGDVAQVDGRKLKIQGRSDRCVKVLGELVSLDDVEREWRKFVVLENAPERVSVVVAEDHVRKGASLVLCVEGREKLNDRVLEKWNGSCHPLYRIEKVSYVDQFARSALGKVLYSSFK